MPDLLKCGPLLHGAATWPSLGPDRGFSKTAPDLLQPGKRRMTVGYQVTDPGLVQVLPLCHRRGNVSLGDAPNRLIGPLAVQDSKRGRPGVLHQVCGCGCVVVLVDRRADCGCRHGRLADAGACGCAGHRDSSGADRYGLRSRSCGPAETMTSANWPMRGMIVRCRAVSCGR